MEDTISFVGALNEEDIAKRWGSHRNETTLRIESIPLAYFKGIFDDISSGNTDIRTIQFIRGYIGKEAVQLLQSETSTVRCVSVDGCTVHPIVFTSLRHRNCQLENITSDGMNIFWEILKFIRLKKVMFALCPRRGHKPLLPTDLLRAMANFLM